MKAKTIAIVNQKGGVGYARTWDGKPTDKKRPNRDEYHCSSYDNARNDYRKPPCTQHYIRTSVVRELILDTLREVSKQITLDEKKFLNDIYDSTSSNE